MPKTKTLPKPQDFGLASFAQILSERPTIPGEIPGSEAAFQAAMMTSLAPLTPYEMVIAENLTAIEWELLQHRRMRDQVIRSTTLQALRKAVIAQRRAEYEAEQEAAWRAWCAAGKDQNAFQDAPFDSEAATAEAEDLAQRSVGPDPKVQSAAQTEMAARGIDLLHLMGNAYREASRTAGYHETKIQDLERRRRSVKADLDALQKVRPVEAEWDAIPDAEVLER